MSRLCVFCTDRCKPWMRCQLWVLFQLDTQASISPRASQVSTGQRMKRGEMKEKRCSDADVCVAPVCAFQFLFVWQVFFLFFFVPKTPLFFPSFSFSPRSIFSAPALLTGGCSRLRYPVRSHYSHCGRRKGQMRDGKTKRRAEQEMRVDEWGEERRIGHCTDKVHHYTVFQETDQDWLELSVDLNK